MKNIKRILLVVPILFLLCNSPVKKVETESYDDRMEWWQDARFGMFIHWGLYAIPAGEWNGETNHAEWIRTTAQIPVEVYDTLINHFNPEMFDPVEWVGMAKEAGMKYIVITSKHHDGFCLFDSEYTEFDVMGAPFKRDILKELADACENADIKMCWYHSIMDWHHPDYLPRRGWETDRSADSADLGRYVQYMKNQLSELVGEYGEIGVLWFDGEWESTWNHDYGQDLYDYVRFLQPNIIINNRVDVGRGGMEGLTRDGGFAGDFGTPEQEIPATGLPDVDWETCMTMNDHWGYNKNDDNWKSTEELIHKLADIASKGGNFLLNVGPKADGTFPAESVIRLKEIGVWMKVNGESIYATSASPFKSLEWGRCTQKSTDNATRLYLHVFEWPEDGKLVVPGIFNIPEKAYLLSDIGKSALGLERIEDAIVIEIPLESPDEINSVIVLDIIGTPDISNPPVIFADHNIFVDKISVTISTNRENVEIRYTLDGTEPEIHSAKVTGQVEISENITLKARCFRDGKAVSGTEENFFSKVVPRKSIAIDGLVHGLKFKLYEGNWDSVPDFSNLNIFKEGIVNNFEVLQGNTNEYYAMTFVGFIEVPETGVYAFYTDSDDGSLLSIGDQLIVDNDGLHGLQEAAGPIALEKGFHPIKVAFFEKTGGDDLVVQLKGPGIDKNTIANDLLYYQK